MIVKESETEQNVVRVTFELQGSALAERINVVGDFNDWDTMATPMKTNGSSIHWKATIELKPGRRYRYRYLLDGKEWLNDWHADDYAENVYGSFDSVVDLTTFLS